MAASIHATNQPLGELNTTPLIDVLLVLLVIFILSVPAATHVVPLTLPAPDAKAAPQPIRPENILSLTATGTITWNGAAVSEADLAATLGALVHLSPEPLVKFQPEPGAPYGASARAVNLVNRSGLASFAIVGTERYVAFGKPR